MRGAALVIYFMNFGKFQNFHLACTYFPPFLTGTLELQPNGLIYIHLLFDSPCIWVIGHHSNLHLGWTSLSAINKQLGKHFVFERTHLKCLKNLL